MLKQKAVETAVKPLIIDNRKKEVPWQPLQKPLSQCRLGLVTTAGVHLENQQPYDVDAKQGDASYRELPADTPADVYRISHTHYDHSEADKDINCVFPIQRLKELAVEGLIKDVADVNFGFMGFIMKPLHQDLKTNARQVADKFIEHNVDTVLLTPG